MLRCICWQLAAALLPGSAANNQPLILPGLVPATTYADLHLLPCLLLQARQASAEQPQLRPSSCHLQLPSPGVQPAL
jgi:hypothetical protein